MNVVTTTVLAISAAILLPLYTTGCSPASAPPANEPGGTGTPRGASAGSTVIAGYCGTCHVPPRPQSHSPAEWPSVVARMEEHRRKNGLAAIPSEDLARIIRYLQPPGEGT